MEVWATLLLSREQGRISDDFIKKIKNVKNINTLLLSREQGRISNDFIKKIKNVKNIKEHRKFNKYKNI